MIRREWTTRVAELSNTLRGKPDLPPQMQEAMALLAAAQAFLRDPMVMAIAGGGELHVRPYEDEAAGALLNYTGPGMLAVGMLEQGREWRLAPFCGAGRPPWSDVTPEPEATTADIYLDCEFMEDRCSVAILSIGLVCGDRRFYAEATDADITKANDWVKANVLPHTLTWGTKGDDDANFQDVVLFLGDTDSIGEHLLEWVHDVCQDLAPNFIGYYCDYDWVLFCWLFGCMIDLPLGFPLYCQDIRQMLEEAQLYELRPEQTGDEHNALADALYNQTLHDWLKIQRKAQHATDDNQRDHQCPHQS